MPFCGKCGNYVEENRSVCPQCGTTVEQQELHIDLTDIHYNKYEDIEKNKVMAVLAYLGILVLIPIFAAKDSKYARFHANQGLVLWLCGFVVEIAKRPLVDILAAMDLWVFVVLVKLLCGIAGVAFFVFAVVGIIHAVTGETKALPILGGIKLLK